MKRTVEIVLGVIGMVGYGLVAALGGFMLFLQNNEDLLQEVVEQNPEMDLNDLNTVMEGMGAGGWALLITSILAIILSLAAIFLIKGNKQPKIAGSIFIVISILGSIVTVGFGIIPGIFLLISGIMCLVRKQGTL
ncbi:hypothetical protein J18TS1_41590 [Oceanobacillus oncorhynchi subsp. incaldanensis]|uniref:DUF4064 domain-containing protein n=1 Tax=Oceanobacillus oncorhynchi TaxID=545501 RepID=A0A0A1MV39_9BACI|nr:DUF4064 domain-containing protein [Oceanobacillus oncorhynchi]GIO21059.1 hypothetical protein J18TS1_41590 [Oceanobacillus oncorhynchi subsp. incaldanensis]CEI83307.1 hypothetical protein BN997_03213 [Oceanobacillus oncorhynchi]